MSVVSLSTASLNSNNNTGPNQHWDVSGFPLVLVFQSRCAYDHAAFSVTPFCPVNFNSQIFTCISLLKVPLPTLV